MVSRFVERVWNSVYLERLESGSLRVFHFHAQRRESLLGVCEALVSSLVRGTLALSNLLKELLVERIGFQVI